ncbi:hypothetical protein AMK21_30060 [Streptomyces sp. CB00316]|uniref:hypothetical protein n=1 Tax=Streptomyces sp. CB00316 TaxID=1703932 RepID=UPI00093DBAEF|nr:hypothetical protein [Streptomyces sp. CB00316]OKJ10539.1 hypothetical protein AMK21_30060 [Streptomyces sp. CB00316]
MPNVIEVPVSSTALLVLMLAFAAVVGPPAVSSVKCWWSIRLRRWSRGLRDVRARLVARVRETLRHFLDGGGGR